MKKTSKIETIRHSYAHVLAAAVLELFPKTQMGVGPAIENGFYHDFDLGKKTISLEDLPRIEERMKEIIKEGRSFEKIEMSIDKALKEAKKYRKELIQDLKKQGKKKVSFYQTGSFINLCKGPHVKSTRELKPDAFKLTKVAGAYWRGDEKNPMLTRIYGVAFNTKEELEEYLALTEEAEKRDHRKLGKELDLFCFSDLVGKGLPLLTPKGAAIRYELEKFIIEEETKRGYLRTYTPDLAKVELYKKSGHWAHYKESMYPPMNIDGEDYVLRPMACPHQFMIYKSRPRSYRELPLRYAEIVKQYRKEQSGELSGLIRVMAFSLADGHIICRPDQIEQEFKNVLDLIKYTMGTIGFEDYWYRFSKWDPNNKEKYINKPKEWQKTQRLMKKMLDKLKVKYVEAEGEAAFYGPKTDIQLRNVNGKEDTIFTVQIDFDLPEKFDLTYTDQKGRQQRPMVIHRSSIGCLERTMAFLIEHYAGAFPVWLAPERVHILPISKDQNAFSKKVLEQMAGIRAVLKDENETLGKKIRVSEQEKVPYILIIGGKEVKSKSVSVRQRGKGDIGQIKIPDFIEKIQEEIKKRM